MGTKTAATPQQSSDSQKIAKLLDQYCCGRLRFSGTENALYERHLFFDSVIDEAGSTARDRFEAFARSIRDVLSQRWILTDKTYEQQNPKRLYYLSMEFLIGRSLANNVTNLLLDPLGKEAFGTRNLNWLELVGAGARRRSRERWTWTPGSLFHRICCHHAASRRWATVCDMNTASSSSPFRTDGSRSSPTTGCARPIHGKSRARNEKVEVELNCSFELSGGSLRAMPGPSLNSDRDPI